MNTQAKRYKVDATDLACYLIGDYADIADFYTTKNGFTVICDLGGETEKIHFTNKELEKELNCKNIIWKNNKDGQLDRITYEKL